MKNKIFFLMLISLLFVVIGSAGVNAEGIDNYTVLMLHMDGTDGGTTFTDDSDSNHTVTANDDARTNTSEKKFGSASAYFDGTGDYLSIPDHASLQIGTSESGTAEFWAYVGSWVDGEVIFGKTSVQGYLQYTSSALRFYSPGNIQTVNFGTPSTGVWHHYALVATGTQHMAFLDGVLVGSAVSTTNGLLGAGSSLFISSLEGVSLYFNGYIDELRISKGIARWTENFTVPTSPYNSEAGFGNLTLSWVSPSASTYVAQNKFWNFTLNLLCSSDGDCGFVNVTLDPWMINELKQGKSLQLDSDGNVVGVIENEEAEINSETNHVKETAGTKEIDAEKSWFEKIIGIIKGMFG